MTAETVIPFRGWRYQQDVAGDLGLLIAPPYDVIDQDLQIRLNDRSPHNVVRVDFGMTSASDTEENNQYTRATALLGQWKDSGVLGRDAEPSMTFVEETFRGPDGGHRTRRGFLALIRLHDFEEGVVFPHELTLSGPKEDRFRVMKATSMSLSPVFLLYGLPGDDITAAWRARIGTSEPDASITDESETVAKVWTTSDPTLTEFVCQQLKGGPFIIADGHHRYETALRYRNYRRETTDQGLGDDVDARPFEYTLAYFSNMADPGLAIYGTHRLLSGLPPERVAALPAALAADFELELLTADPGAASAAISAYLDAHSNGGAFGLCGPLLDGAYGIALARPEAAYASALNHSPAYNRLDVSILHGLILEELLGISGADLAAQTKITYFKNASEAFRRLYNGDFQAGFFLNPTRFDQIRDVALNGERMPQKTTFFFPKLPTGLVFHDLTVMRQTPQAQTTSKDSSPPK